MKYKLKFENCGSGIFLWRLIILLTDPIFSHSSNFGRPKQGQKFVVPTFHTHFLNPECVRIPWVLAPKNFPVQNFRVRSVLQKSSIFHWFLLPPPKKKCRARVPTILMPETFPIASLNRYTPNFSGVTQKLTWAIRKSFQCILQAVRFLLANHTLLSGTSKTFSYWFLHRFGFSPLTPQSNGVAW